MNEPMQYLPCPVCAQPAPANVVLRHKETQPIHAKLSDFAELKLLIDEYDPSNSDWNFRKNVLPDVLVRIWPRSPVGRVKDPS